MSDLIAGRQWGQKCVKRKQKRFLEHGDDQIPGNGYSETLCHLLLPLLLSDLPKQRQHPLEKEDKKKISWSGSSHIRLLQLPPQLNKVTLCWTLRWHSLFMCLMNLILKGQTAHMLHSGRNQSMFKNSDKRLSRVSERCKIYTYALFEFGQQIIAMLVLHHAAVWTPSEEKYLTVSWF